MFEWASKKSCHFSPPRIYSERGLYLIFLLSFAIWTGDARAQNSEWNAIKAEELLVTYNGENSVVYEFGETLDPATFCKSLSELFRNSESNGYGMPFKTASCLGDSLGSKLKQGQWRLEIDAKLPAIRLRLLFQMQDGVTPTELATVTFPQNPKLDSHNLQLVLTELFDQSPFLARIVKAPDFNAAKTSKIEFPCQVGSTIQPPAEIFVYHLHWSKPLKIFQPIVIAKGSIDKSLECPAWNITSTGVKQTPNESLFLHNKLGRGKGGYFKNISFASAKDPSTKPLAGIAGFRYSHPLEKDLQTGMIAKTKIFSLLAELRYGRLKGLRAYIDYTPKAEGVVKETGAKTSIKFERYVFGYSFNFKPWDPKFSFNIIPKLGIWNLRSRLPLYSTEVGNPPEVLPFDLKFKPSGTIDFDAEYEPFYNFVIRGYVAIGIGIGISQDKNRTLVTSQRIGSDLIWSPKMATAKFPFKVGYTVAYFQETNTLKRVDVPVDPDESFIGAFSYHQNYLSGGVVVAW